MERGTEPPTISVSPKGDGSIAVSGFNFSPNDPVHIRIVDAALTNLFFTSKSNSGVLQQFRLYVGNVFKEAQHHSRKHGAACDASSDRDQCAG